MTTSLQTRLSSSKELLTDVLSALGRNPGKLPTGAEDAYREFIDARASIDYWLALLDARKEAWGFIDGLEDEVDGHGRVPFGKSRASFQAARFLGVQSYLTTTWALTDRIVGSIGRVVCTVDTGRNDQNPTQLVKHFIQKDRKKSPCSVLFYSIRDGYGWPIGVSYAIRNHFVHDGAEYGAEPFFEGSVAGAGFRISREGWARIEKTVATVYDVDDSCQRDRASWPSTPRDDLREVLAACERELDDVLGVLLGSACHLLMAHVGFLAGEA